MPRPLLPVLLALAVGTGCSTRRDEPPAQVVKVTLEETSRKALLEVKLGRELRIELPPPLQPGLVWKLTYSDARYVRLLADVTPPGPDSDRSIVRFLTIRPGRSQMRFHAVPPVELREVRPSDAYDVVAVISP